MFALISMLYHNLHNFRILVIVIDVITPLTIIYDICIGIIGVQYQNFMLRLCFLGLFYKSSLLFSYDRNGLLVFHFNCDPSKQESGRREEWDKAVTKQKEKIFLIKFASVGNGDSIRIELLRGIQTPPRITSQRMRGSGIYPLVLVLHCLRVFPKGFNSSTIMGSTFT